MRGKLVHLVLLVALVMAMLSVSCSHISPINKPKRGGKVLLKPRVTIRNQSDREIVLGLDGPEVRLIRIPASASRKVELKPGAYQYALAAENIQAVSGNKHFKANHAYTWNLGVDQVQGVSF
jgi:hypothetical protein